MFAKMVKTAKASSLAVRDALHLQWRETSPVVGSWMVFLLFKKMSTLGIPNDSPLPIVRHWERAKTDFVAWNWLVI